jgi:hypothetical protein
MSLDALSAFGEPGFSPLVDVGNEVLLPELQRRLASFGLGSSALANSVQIEVEGDEIRIIMADYAKYVNFGVMGTNGGTAIPDNGYIHRYGTKMPPPSVFARYSGDKGVQFAIAKKIQKFGIQPREFIPTDGDRIWAQINAAIAERTADGLEKKLPNIVLQYES